MDAVKVSRDVSGATAVVIPHDPGVRRRVAYAMVACVLSLPIVYSVIEIATADGWRQVVGGVGFVFAVAAVVLPLTWWMTSRLHPRRWRLRVGPDVLSAAVEPAKPDIRPETIPRGEVADVRLVRVTRANTGIIIAVEQPDGGIRPWLRPSLDGRSDLGPWRDGLAAVRRALRPGDDDAERHDHPAPAAELDLPIPSSGLLAAVAGAAAPAAVVALALSGIVMAFRIVAGVSGFDPLALLFPLAGGAVFAVTLGLILLLLTLHAPARLTLAAGRLRVLDRRGRAAVDVAAAEIAGVRVVRSRLLVNDPWRDAKVPPRLIIGSAGDAGETWAVEALRHLRPIPTDGLDELRDRLRAALNLPA